MTSPSDRPAHSREPSDTLRWRSWPARENVARTLLLSTGLLGAGLLIDWLTGSPYMAVWAVSALVVSLWRFFVPVVFELSERGVGQRILTRHRHIPWTAIRRCEIGAAGVLLLPGDDRSIMSPFGGLYLPWGGYRDEVLSAIRDYLHDQEPSAGR